MTHITMHTTTVGDFEADESQYLLSDTETEYRTSRPSKLRGLCCLCYCVRNILGR